MPVSGLLKLKLLKKILSGNQHTKVQIKFLGKERVNIERGTPQHGQRSAPGRWEGVSCLSYYRE